MEDDTQSIQRPLGVRGAQLKWAAVLDRVISNLELSIVDGIICDEQIEKG